MDVPAYITGFGGGLVENVLSEVAAGIVSQFEYFQKLFGDTAIDKNQVNASMHKDHAGRFMCKPSEEILLDNFTKKVINTLILVSS